MKSSSFSWDWCLNLSFRGLGYPNASMNLTGFSLSTYCRWCLGTALFGLGGAATCSLMAFSCTKEASFKQR